MADVIPAARDQAPSGGTQRFLGTFAAVFALIAAFLVLDFALARIERDATRRHAQDLYAQGLSSLRAGDIPAANDRLASAVSLERDDIPYALALAEAVAAEGRSADAERQLADLLVRAPNSGAVNLVMAHLLAAGRRRNDAKEFFHRAIYGRWGSDSIAERRNARFELIDLLASGHAQAELLAELLPLEASQADSTLFLRRVAPLYLRAGSPLRAADAFRHLLTRAPDDADAHAGLGEAALSLGEFQVARNAFAAAKVLRPADSSFAVRFRLADTLRPLDPAARVHDDLALLASYRVLLQRALTLTAACATPAVSPDWMALRDSSQAELDVRASRMQAGSRLEHTRGLVESLWHARGTACPKGAVPEDDLLTRILDRTAR